MVHGCACAGSVLDSSVDNVLSRLRGLCDNMEAESFADHEIVFLLKPGQGSPFVIRARHALDRPGVRVCGDGYLARQRAYSCVSLSCTCPGSRVVLSALRYEPGDPNLINDYGQQR